MHEFITSVAVDLFSRGFFLSFMEITHFTAISGGNTLNKNYKLRDEKDTFC